MLERLNVCITLEQLYKGNIKDYIEKSVVNQSDVKQRKSISNKPLSISPTKLVKITFTPHGKW